MVIKNLEAEQGVLGGILTDPDSIYRVLKYLDGSEFTTVDHSSLFDAFKEISKGGGRIEMLTVKKRLMTLNINLGGDWGLSLCANLEEITPTSKNVEIHAQMIRDCFLKNRLARELRELSGDCETDEFSDVKGRLLEIARRSGETVESEQNFAEMRHEFEKRMAERWKASANGKPASGISSGIRRYDQKTGGIYLTELVVMAGYTGVGKSAVLAHLCAHLSGMDVPVGAWTLEMPNKDMAERIMSNIGGIENNYLRIGNFGSLADESRALGAIDYALEKMSKAPLWYYDKNGTIDQIISSMFVAQKKHGIKVFLVDYLQRIAAGREERNMKRHEQIETMARRFKEFAKANECAVILFAQVNRASLQNPNAEPELENLREGAVEHEADVVVLLSRKKESGDLMFKVAKNRHGELGHIDLLFEPEFSRISEKY